MAETFPVTLSKFFDAIGIVTMTFDLSESMTGDETNGGEIIGVSLGARLWSGSATVRIANHADADRFSAKINLLRQPAASFYASPIYREGPQSDPSGAGLSAFSPKLNSVANNNRDITISGLPAGFVLTQGDKLSFVYNGRQAFHEIYKGGTANSSGVRSGIEVTPPIRGGYQEGSDIQLVSPQVRAKIVPNTFTPTQYAGVLATGYSFSWRQTLK